MPNGQTDTWYCLRPAGLHPPSASLTPADSSVSFLDVDRPLVERLGELLLARRETWEAFLGPRVRQFDFGPPPGPSMAFGVLEHAAAKDPEGWAPVEAVLRADPEYAQLRDEIGRVDAETRRADDAIRRAGEGRRPAWPEAYALRQQDGARRWGPLVQLAFGVQLADARFLRALTDAGLTRGWTSMPANVFDRRDCRATTHRLLAVSGRVARRGFRGLAATADGSGGAAGVDLAREAVDADADAARPGLYGTGAVREALARAGVTGIEFELHRGGMDTVDRT